MQVVSTLLAIVGLVREVWGLLRDIKRKDPDFSPQKTAKRLQGAIRGYREDQSNAPEIVVLASILGEKLTGRKQKL